MVTDYGEGIWLEDEWVEFDVCSEEDRYFLEVEVKEQVDIEVVDLNVVVWLLGVVEIKVCWMLFLIL